MKTQNKDIAKFVATAIWADGVYEEAEKECLSNIAEALEIEEKEFIKCVESEFEFIKDKDEDSVNKLLKETGKNIFNEEKWLVYEAVLEILLSDNTLTKEEVANMLAIAEALDFNKETAILLLADMIKDEPEINIDIEI